MNASNDKVAQGNLADAVASQGTLTTFSKAIVAAGLTDILTGTGPLTVFAPSNAAFDKLEAGQLEGWLKPENKAQLISVLKYHVSPGRTMNEQIGRLKETTSVSGRSARFGQAEGKTTIGGANITTADVGASNGVIHVIDAVMVPEEKH